MDNLNLVLTFKVDGKLHVKGAARIKVDGSGGMMVYDPQSGASETIDLRRLETLHIQPMHWSNAEMPVLAVA